jgi:LAS superfamily LD-carboxypeptidase LdcB
VRPRPSLLYSSSYIASGAHYLRTEARDALYQMADAYYAQTKQNLTLVSAYRSYAFQLSIVTDSCKQRRLCAVPGRSEHQAGLAVDLGGDDSERIGPKSREYQWLRAHAHKYGRHQTYQHGPKVDGYTRELWHWRYVGIPLATFLHQQKLTLGQWYEKISVLKRFKKNL